MKFHPLADLFPLIPEPELTELTDDIRKNGLIGSITTYQGKILDGRNRFLACKKLKVEPKLREYRGSDPLAFVISANLRRRHLNESQRALIAAKLASALNSDNASVPIGTVTREKAAKMLNVGVRSVARAKKILNEGTPRQVAEVERGGASVSSITHEIDDKKKAKAARRGELSDQTGHPIPENALEYWNRINEAKEILSYISKARSAIKMLEANDPMYVEVNINGVLGRLNQAYNEFNPAVPHAVCPVCQGATPKTCTLCKGRAVISKFKWDTCVPQELKDLREKGIQK